MQATPSPIFGIRAELRRKGVSFDVTADCQKMLVVLDRKRFETPLVHMPLSGRVVMSVITLSVGEREPLTEASHFTVHAR